MTVSLLKCTKSPAPVPILVNERAPRFGTSCSSSSCRQPSECHCGTTGGRYRVLRYCPLVLATRYHIVSRSGPRLSRCCCVTIVHNLCVQANVAKYGLRGFGDCSASPPCFHGARSREVAQQTPHRPCCTPAGFLHSGELRATRLSLFVDHPIKHMSSMWSPSSSRRHLWNFLQFCPPEPHPYIRSLQDHPISDLWRTDSLSGPHRCVRHRTQRCPFPW